MSDQANEAVGRWMERYRLQFIAGIALSGLVITLLSFVPWVEFRSLEGEDVTPGVPGLRVSVPGTSLSAWRDEDRLVGTAVKEEEGWCSCRMVVGDGWITAGLGLAMLAAAAGAWLSGRIGTAATCSLVASLTAVGLAGFNAFAKWNAYLWSSLQNLEAAEGEVQLWLFALVAATVIGALLSSLLLTEALLEQRDDETLEDDDYDYAEEEDENSEQAYSVLGGARWA